MADTPRIALKATHRALGLWLAFIAGAINAGGFLVLGYYTSHMTGIGSSIGDAIATHHYHAAFVAISLLVSFLTGAITTSLLVNFQRDRKPGTEYSRTLQLQALLLLLLVVLAIDPVSAPAVQIISFAMLLCFMMGLQNAMITKISDATIRTTHITGLITDIGIETGRHLYRNISKNEQITTQPEKIALFSALVGMFIGGGIIGAIGFSYLGFLSLLPLIAILISLSLSIARL